MILLDKKRGKKNEIRDESETIVYGFRIASRIEGVEWDIIESNVPTV